MFLRNGKQSDSNFSRILVYDSGATLQMSFIPSMSSVLIPSQSEQIIREQVSTNLQRTLNLSSLMMSIEQVSMSEEENLVNVSTRIFYASDKTTSQEYFSKLSALVKTVVETQKLVIYLPGKQQLHAKSSSVKLIVDSNSPPADDDDGDSTEESKPHKSSNAAAIVVPLVLLAFIGLGGCIVYFVRRRDYLKSKFGHMFGLRSRMCRPEFIPSTNQYILGFFYMYTNVAFLTMLLCSQFFFFVCCCFLFYFCQGIDFFQTNPT